MNGRFERRMASGMRLACVVSVVLLGTGTVQASKSRATHAMAPHSERNQHVADIERWNGAIQVNGQTLDVILELTRSAAPIATLEIPAQGLKATKVSDLKVDGSKVSFRLEVAALPVQLQPEFEADLSADAGTGSGTMLQGGRTLQMSWKRLREGDPGGPSRPQHPRGVPAYRVEEVTIRNEQSGGVLTGTLTLPEAAKFGDGPYGAAILITGSGAQDRDETIVGHKPFWVIADDLTKRGVAVLRVDDRGVGGSTSPKGGQETTDDFVTDVVAQVEYLKARKEIDRARIGLIGHSEGGLIAPMAASSRGDVAFIVLMAGTGVSGRLVLEEQMIALLRASGVGGEMISEIGEAQKKVLDLVVSGASDEQVDGALKELLTAQRSPTDEDTLKQAKAQINSAWMRRFLVIDPVAYLRRVKCPVLVLNGSLDTQVIAWQNVPPIVKALSEAGNAEYQVNVIRGVNHLFQTATTGGVAEYAQSEETISPRVLEMMGEWVSRRAVAVKSSEKK